MKKLIATLMLLMCFSVTFAGKTGTTESAIPTHKKNVCYDEAGKWNPTDKTCNRNACDCLWHEIKDFAISIFG